MAAAAALAYARLVAVDPFHALAPSASSNTTTTIPPSSNSSPLTIVTDPPERIALLALRDRLYCGPPSKRARRNPAGTASTTGGIGNHANGAPKLEDRPCTPSNFVALEDPEVVAALPAAAALDLDRVAKRYYQAPDSRPTNGGDVVLPSHHHTTLGALLLPVSHVPCTEKWSARDVAVFESGISIYGKRFDLLAQLFEGKSPSDVVEFYYSWKKTPHHAMWKKTFKAADVPMP
jgi:hypothetical protein